jgi:hypothetical protein
MGKPNPVRIYRMKINEYEYECAKAMERNLPSSPTVFFYLFHHSLHINIGTDDVCK